MGKRPRNLKEKERLQKQALNEIYLVDMRLHNLVSDLEKQKLISSSEGQRVLRILLWGMSILQYSIRRRGGSRKRTKKKKILAKLMYIMKIIKDFIMLCFLLF